MYDKSLITISKILDAAQKLFVAKNYDDITMAEIAGAADVTKGAIYHHFSSKETLFIRMMGRYLESLTERLQPTVDGAGPTRDRLCKLTALYLTMPLAEQKVVQLVRRDSNRFQGETRAELVTAYQAALPDQIGAIIQDGMNAGEIGQGDVRLMAWHYVAIVEVSLTSYAREQFSDPHEMAAYVTDLFLNGVREKKQVIK